MHDRVFKHTEAHKLEDPERAKRLPLPEILGHLKLLPAMKVADVGAGTGYFSIPIAHAVGDSGHVFAADLQPEMLDLLRQKLSQPEMPTNISLLQGDASALPLPDRAVDLAFFANIWHELENHDAAFAEAQRISLPSGKIAILDWRADCASPPGPPQDHRISDETVASFLRTKGCESLVSRHIGPYAYLVTANLPTAS